MLTAAEPAYVWEGGADLGPRPANPADPGEELAQGFWAEVEGLLSLGSSGSVGPRPCSRRWTLPTVAASGTPVHLAWLPKGVEHPLKTFFFSSSSAAASARASHTEATGPGDVELLVLTDPGRGGQGQQDPPLHRIPCVHLDLGSLTPGVGVGGGPAVSAWQADRPGNYRYQWSAAGKPLPLPIGVARRLLGALHHHQHPAKRALPLLVYCKDEEGTLLYLVGVQGRRKGAWSSLRLLQC
jgi:hypothetical protein